MRGTLRSATGQLALMVPHGLARATHRLERCVRLGGASRSHAVRPPCRLRTTTAAWKAVHHAHVELPLDRHHVALPGALSGLPKPRGAREPGDGAGSTTCGEVL